MIGNILTYAVGSLFWGFLIALACISLLLLLIKGWYKDAFLKPVTYVVAVVLGLFLTYNCTVICGAVAIKSDIDHFESMIGETLKASFSDYNDMVDKTMSNEIVQQIAEEYPILYYYVDSVNYEGQKLSELPHVITDTFRGYLNKVIVKNLLWTIAFIAIGVFVIVKTIGKSVNQPRRSRSRHHRDNNRAFTPRRTATVNRRYK